jgi:hypothetical protein
MRASRAWRIVLLSPAEPVSMRLRFRARASFSRAGYGALSRVRCSEEMLWRPAFPSNRFFRLTGTACCRAGELVMGMDGL